MNCYYESENRLKTRLNRIEGQVRGISKMVEEKRDCIDIINQISSIQSALRGVWKEIIRCHLSNCITDAIKNDKKSEELIDELMEHINDIK